MVQQVDGDTSTNDTVIALASGLSGSTRIASIDSYEALELQACLDVVCCAAIKLFTHLYKFIHCHQIFVFVLCSLRPDPNKTSVFIYSQVLV